MAGQTTQDLPDMSTSTSDPAHRSRGGSLSSVSSTMKLEREALSQALDQIHFTASQSDTLTAFNDFSSPPPSTSVDESAGGTGSLVPTGLGGLYSRLRGAVGAVKEKAGAVVGSSDHRTPDLLAHGSGTTPTPSAKTTVTELRLPEVTASSPSSSLPSGSGQQRARTSVSTLASTIDGDSKKSSKASSDMSHPSTGTPSALRLTSISHTPLTKPTISAAVNPTVAPVNVIARRDAQSGNLKEGSQTAIGTVDVMSSKNSSVSGQAIRIKGDKDSSNLPSETSSIHEKFPITTWPTSHIVSQAPPDEALRRLAEGDTREQTGQLSIESVASSSQFQQNNFIDNDGYSKQRGQGTMQNVRSADALPSEVDREQSTTTNQVLALTQPEVVKADSMLVDVSGPQDSLPETSTISTRRNDQMASEQSATKRSSSHEQQKKQAGISLLPGYSLSRASSFDGFELSHQGQSAQLKAKGREDDSKTRSRTDHSRQPEESFGGENIGDGATGQTRSKVLSKDFWMKDENCKECFLCGDTFSTFRRKHHCRKSNSLL